MNVCPLLTPCCWCAVAAAHGCRAHHGRRGRASGALADRRAAAGRANNPEHGPSALAADKNQRSRQPLPAPALPPSGAACTKSVGKNYAAPDCRRPIQASAAPMPYRKEGSCRGGLAGFPDASGRCSPKQPLHRMVSAQGGAVRVRVGTRGVWAVCVFLASSQFLLLGS
ncbi:hypothetical protein appser10_8230 [Actinobacillus pleuropneumoniae serovar 10 str. D13039]|nr:hypothetical protein appser10_8230 [Actinobacillus pleuropneumoniae serovar 10 str. D13039]